eukprot:5902315-Pleurochrysis_carterae.AAC.1
MSASAQYPSLKGQLEACIQDRTLQYKIHPLSIAHRGAPQQFPEHTLESNRAAIAMGAAPTAA